MKTPGVESIAGPAGRSIVPYGPSGDIPLLQSHPTDSAAGQIVLDLSPRRSLILFECAFKAARTTRPPFLFYPRKALLIYSLNPFHDAPAGYVKSLAMCVDFHPSKRRSMAAIRNPIHAPGIFSAISNRALRVTDLLVSVSAFMAFLRKKVPLSLSEGIIQKSK